MIVDNLNRRSENRPSHEAAAHRRSRAALLLLAPALLSLGLAGGCGASRPIKYYQLTVPGDLAPSNAQSLPVTIIVHLPAASDLYRDSRVVYGVGEQQMGAYEYERWVGPPPVLIQSVLLRQLRGSGHYGGVYTPQSKEGGDFALLTRIYDFKEQDSGSSLVGRLTMDIELRNIKTGEAVWRTYYTHDEPISAKTVADVVAALNRNVQLAAGNISSGMDQYFAAHPPK
jgi:ABC-type uncharacterized transport system auxiliary subunit